MVRHALAPCCCSRTYSVRLGHIPRDDKGSSSPRRPEGQADRRSGRGPLRKRQPTQEVLIPTDVGGLTFRLPTLEPYDGSTDPTEHVAVFRAQMALYDNSNALMCHTFPTTLRGPARMWYSRIKPSSISSFDQFTKEFELNFTTSSCLRSMTTSLLGLTQGNDEPLA
ncbi:hypothetical protein B296_00000580 [Ensete ventricosum]|uniref:Retrotransposon gag domain-containing protein n=1 Tax=Ensete ventricosum TaxID=4639 RepID=A0A427B1S0_ENSVE|nr:hypothetical protein B296_00000580 [Ensete ventricosum]